MAAAIKEGQSNQESGCPQITRAAKDKEKAAQAAAVAAAKLEQFSHTIVKSPGKAVQHSQTQVKNQTGAATDRKSGGQGSSAPKVKKNPVVEPQGGGAMASAKTLVEVPLVNTADDPRREEEPTLKKILSAINACRGVIE